MPTHRLQWSMMAAEGGARATVQASSRWAAGLEGGCAVQMAPHCVGETPTVYGGPVIGCRQQAPARGVTSEFSVGSRCRRRPDPPWPVVNGAKAGGSHIRPSDRGSSAAAAPCAVHRRMRHHAVRAGRPPRPPDTPASGCAVTGSGARAAPRARARLLAHAETRARLLAHAREPPLTTLPPRAVRGTAQRRRRARGTHAAPPA